MSYIQTDLLKFDDPEVKKQSVATRYRTEQEQTAMAAVFACPTQNCAVELYAGTGGLTRLYRDNGFTKVITNDLNKQANTDLHMKAMDYIKEYMPLVKDKIDLIDFDCYGCPALEIQEYFKVRGNKDAPFVLRFSDGLGLYLKRNKNQDVVRKRYLIEGEIVMEKIWLRHPQLIDYFLNKCATMYGMKATNLMSIQTRYKNYTLGAYKFENI